MSRAPQPSTSTPAKRPRRRLDTTAEIRHELADIEADLLADSGSDKTFGCNLSEESDIDDCARTQNTCVCVRAYL